MSSERKGVAVGRIGRLNATVNTQPKSESVEDIETHAKQCKEGDQCKGVVYRIASNRQFAFIDAGQCGNFFFHQSAVKSRNDCLFMGIGERVFFTIGSNNQGLCATEVKLEFTNNLKDLTNSTARASACVINYRKGVTYGFAIVPNYGEVMIRNAEFCKPEQWQTLKEGDRITLIVDSNEKGFFGREIVIESNNTVEGSS